MGKTITPGSILDGPFWQERLKVLSIKNIGKDKTKIEAVGITTNTFYPCILSQEKRNVAFAMVILQRRLASSVRAVRKSLERRKKRLQELYEKGQLLQEGISYTEEYLEDLTEKERWQKEEEINKIDELILLAKEVEKKESETKLNELKKVR